jgi:hypothetical protein
MRISQRAAAVLCAAAVLSVLAHPAGAAGYCKTLKGAFVGFGEQTTRGDAEKALDKEIATWEQRSGLKAKPKDRKVGCEVYIGWLNEFECTAEAVVCR